MPMVLRFYALRFRRGFRFGWWNPLPYIDASTVHRAFIRLGYHLGMAGRIYRLIAEGRLAATAVQPAVYNGRCLRLLTPFPPLPRVGKAKPSWIGLNEASKIARFVEECRGRSGRPFVEMSPVAPEGSVRLVCRGAEAGGLEFRMRAGIVLGRGVEEARVSAVGEEASETHNVLDRVTGAARPYPLRYYKPWVPYWLAVYTEDDVGDVVDVLVRLLGELGLGGGRRAGLGFYELIDAKPCEDDARILEGAGIGGTGYRVILSSMPHIDGVAADKSYYELRVSEGYSNSHTPLPLPRVLLYTPGSLLYIERQVPRVVTVEGSADPLYRGIDGSRRISLFFTTLGVHAG